MFASIRRHQKWLLIVIMSLVIISFVVYLDPATSGRRGGVRLRRDSQEYGLINGRPLSREELLEALQDVRLESRVFTGRWPEDDEASRQMFNMDARMQQHLVFLEKINELNVQVSDQAVADWISKVFRDSKNNRFQLEFYQQFLKEISQQGIAEADFQRFVRRQVAMEHLIRLAGVSGGLVPRGEAEALFRRDSEQMTAQVALFSLSNYLATVAITDAALAQFYTNNMPRYRTPDRVQVSYVKFDLTNFLAGADQFLGQRTNLDLELQAEYRRRGPDYFKDATGKVMLPEAALAKMKEDYRRGIGLVEARKQATAFAQQVYDLYEKQPNQTNNLERVASALGYQAAVTEPFGRTESPAGLSVPQGFAEAAIALSPEQPMTSGPLVGEDAAFVIAFKNRLPSEVPPLAAVRDRVVEDYRRREALDAARRAGQIFYSALTNGLAQNRAFDVVCAEAKVQPVVLPPFALNTRSLRGWEGRIDLTSVKDAAATLSPGKVSDFIKTDEGGFVLQLMSKQPVDEAVMKAELPGFIAQLRAERERQAFNEWFHKQMTSAQVSLRNSGRSKSPTAN